MQIAWIRLGEAKNVYVIRRFDLRVTDSGELP